MSDVGAGLFRSLTASATAGGTFIGGVPAFREWTASAQINDPVAFRALTAANDNVNGAVSFAAMTVVSTDIGTKSFAPMTAQACELGSVSFASMTAVVSVENGAVSLAAMITTATGIDADVAACSLAPMTASASERSDYGVVPMTAVGQDSVMAHVSFLPLVADGKSYQPVSFLPMTAFGNSYPPVSFLPLSLRGFDLYTRLLATTENPNAELFPGWAINYETNAPSRYEGLAANSMCHFNGVTYVANAGGIYALNAADDAGQPIRASITLPKTDYGSSKNKRVSYAYVGLRSIGKLRIKSVTNNLSGLYYTVTPPDANMRGSRVKFGEGIEGRYWTFRLENTAGADFEADSLEFKIDILKRHGV